MNDTIRAAIILLLNNLLALAILFGLNLSGEQVAGITSLVNVSLTLGMLIWKSGQAPDPNKVITVAGGRDGQGQVTAGATGLPIKS